ncbi:MAG TPA: GntR family transcriptional regulator [Syntrophobacteraceae bacterium]|nr:GntR family transcriptional regulator [Syntrophobacteraceae bacterium]
MLNPQSPIPLYRQLADLMMAKIRSGEYAPGSRIPSEHSLADQYGIGRPTVRQATDWLVRKQILHRRRGSGTYVLPAREEIDLFSLAGTLSAFQKKGVSITGQLLESIHLVDVGPDAENPFSGRKAFFLSRLSLVGRAPVLIEDIYLLPELFQGIDQIDLKGRSLSQIVDELYYLRPTGGKQNFRIGYLKGEKAKVLDVSPSTPILLVKRFLHFAPAPNAVYSELFCRTDQFVFSQTIGGSVDE